MLSQVNKIVAEQTEWVLGVVDRGEFQPCDKSNEIDTAKLSFICPHCKRQAQFTTWFKGGIAHYDSMLRLESLKLKHKCGATFRMNDDLFWEMTDLGSPINKKQTRLFQ